MIETEEKWTTEIRPKDKLLSVDFKEIWRYRDLMMLFVKRNIITQYKQTILGPLWFVIQPLMTTVMYMVDLTACMSFLVTSETKVWTALITLSSHVWKSMWRIRITIG